MVNAKQQRGLTLLEMVISMAILGIFLTIFFLLTAEIRMWEKRLPVNMMKHPQVMSVLARMRRDVLDVHLQSADKMYLDYPPYENSPKTLVIQTLLETGLETIIWDLREPGVARRISYNVGVPTEWVARGLPPDFSAEFDAVRIKDRPWAVRLIAKDSNGKIAIDQILQPRSHP